MKRIETIEQLELILDSPEFTEGEKSLYKWQYQRHGSFWTQFWEMVATADSENLNKLSKGFPSEIRAYLNFVNTGKLVQKTSQFLENLEK